MKNNINLYKAVLIAVLTLSILFTGQFLYRHFAFSRPLVDELTNIPGVSGYQLTEKNSNEQLLINLAMVDNLQKTYLQVTDVLAEVYDEVPGITIQDNPNEQLNQIWHESQFAVYQALATGRFVDMHAEIAAINQRYEHAKVKVFMDDESVYFQATAGEHYLYRIVDRKDEGGEPVA